MPLLLAGLDCLHEQVRERAATLQNRRACTIASNWHDSNASALNHPYSNMLQHHEVQFQQPKPANHSASNHSKLDNPCSQGTDQADTSPRTDLMFWFVHADIMTQC